MAVEWVIESGALSAELVLNVLARLNAGPAPVGLETSLQLTEAPAAGLGPLANTDRYDSRLGTNEDGEVITTSAKRRAHWRAGLGHGYGPRPAPCGGRHYLAGQAGTLLFDGRFGQCPGAGEARWSGVFGDAKLESCTGALSLRCLPRCLIERHNTVVGGVRSAFQCRLDGFAYHGVVFDQQIPSFPLQQITLDQCAVLADLCLNSKMQITMKASSAADAE